MTTLHPRIFSGSTDHLLAFETICSTLDQLGSPGKEMLDIQLAASPDETTYIPCVKSRPTGLRAWFSRTPVFSPAIVDFVVRFFEDNGKDVDAFLRPNFTTLMGLQERFKRQSNLNPFCERLQALVDRVSSSHTRALRRLTEKIEESKRKAQTPLDDIQKDLDAIQKHQKQSEETTKQRIKDLTQQRHERTAFVARRAAELQLTQQQRKGVAMKEQPLIRASTGNPYTLPDENRKIEDHVGEDSALAAFIKKHLGAELLQAPQKTSGTTSHILRPFFPIICDYLTTNERIIVTQENVSESLKGMAQRTARVVVADPVMNPSPRPSPTINILWQRYQSEVADKAVANIRVCLRNDHTANKLVYDIINVESHFSGQTFFYHAMRLEAYLYTLFTQALFSTALGQDSSTPLLRFPEPEGDRNIHEFLKRYPIDDVFDNDRKIATELLSVNPNLFSNVCYSSCILLREITAKFNVPQKLKPKALLLPQ